MIDVFLDVDGVLNAVCGPDVAPAWDWNEDAIRVTVDRFPITYSPALVDRLNTFAARPDVTMHWLTTWNHAAPDLLAPAIGLNGAAWPVIGEGDWRRAEVRRWWKHIALVRHGTPNRMVWIDDDLWFDKAAVEWLRVQGSSRVLGVSPESGVGLTRRQVDRVEEWIAGR